MQAKAKDGKRTGIPKLTCQREQQTYLYRQSLPHQTLPSTPDQPQLVRRLLDELQETKHDLKEARREAESLVLQLAQAEEARQSLTEQLRYCQQQGSRWRKRLRQTEALLKRVVRKNRELVGKSVQSNKDDAINL